MDELVRAAARNNAAWCDVVWRSHGLPTIREHGYWASGLRAPAAYPDAVTVEPGVEPGAILARIDDSPGASIKDSFADLDLRPHGYEVVFDAEWYAGDPGPIAEAGQAREPASPGPAGRAGPPGAEAAGRRGWRVVETPAELAAWARAHGGGDVFRPGLLEDPDIRVLVRDNPDGSVAGAVASLAAGVAEVSNVFTQGAPERAWDGLPDALRRLAPGRALVGYGTGDDLAGALRAGFVAIGPLRVWRRR